MCVVVIIVQCMRRVGRCVEFMCVVFVCVCVCVSGEGGVM